MNNTQNQTDSPEAPQPGDPRHGLAQVTSQVRELIENTSAEQFELPTPCEEYNVRELLDHLVLVMNRLAVIGSGEHFSNAMPEDFVLESGHGEAFVNGAHGVMESWGDAAKLEQMFEVPWGELPGVAVVSFYTAELATHGWDLATATGRELSISDDVLGAALFAAKSVPEEGREDPFIPFAEAIDPGEDAPALLQIAGWFGRKVS